MTDDFEVARRGTKILLDRYDATIARLKKQIGAGKKVATKYHELLYAVETKTPGESRHETALRYIQQSESCNEEARACGDNVGELRGVHNVS